jgi:hypothetical protein
MELIVFSAGYLAVATIIFFRLLADRSVDNTLAFGFLALGAGILWPIVLFLYYRDSK